MSVIFSLRVEGRDRKATPSLPTGGQDFWANKKALDAVTRAARVPSLFSYIHSLSEEHEWTHQALGSPDLDAMDAEHESRYHDSAWQMTGKAGKWHRAADGLRTVDAVLRHLQDKGGDSIPGVEGDLKALRKALVKATTAAERFRLAGEKEAARPA